MRTWRSADSWPNRYLEVAPAVGHGDYGERGFSPSGVTVIVYALLAVLALGVGGWIGRSPVLRAMIRGRGTDPGQFGTWMDHLDDIGLGVSWRNDGYGGRRESQVLSKHTRRH